MISTHLEDWTEYLEKSSWIKSENNGWEFGRNVPYSPKYLPTTDLNSYKKPFWERGILHHEDVLYFAYKIFDSHPQLFDPLSARFPYLFVDEFQDTQPAQAKLVKELADHGTKVGVIGDAEQAIYGFRGATDEVLKNISSHEKYGIGEIEEYKIIGNRRSTTAIVNFLNQIRSDDLEQNAINPPNINESLKCIFGDKNEVLSKTKDYLYQSSNSEDLELAVLAWRNDDVSNFCVLNSGIEPDIDETWELFRENDSNSYRRRLVKQALRAVKILNLEEDGDSQRSGIAIREMKKAIRVRDGSLRKPFNQTANVSKLERRALAMETVRHFSTAVENDSSQNLYEAYSRLDERLSSVVPGHGLTGYGRGNTRSFAESVSLQELLDSVYTSQPEGNEIRTIHKAKGAEFDNVLVWFPEENVLKEVLEGESSEQRKIYYVAMSRAKHRLFFGVGTNDLSSETESVLNKLDVECLSVSDG